MASEDLTNKKVSFLLIVLNILYTINSDLGYPSKQLKILYQPHITY